MLRLTLWNNAETEQHIIDLYANVPVNLNYQWTDVSEVQKTKGSYSQTFRVPATRRNKRFFGSIDKPNVQDANDLIIANYSVKRKIRAELSYNSVLLMRGFVQVKSVYLQKKDYADIELIFFAEPLDLARALGEKKLVDLNLSSLNHTLNYSNVALSWYLVTLSGNVVYGIMDKGFNWSFETGGNTPWTDSDGLFQSEMTPHVRVKKLLDQIMADAGFTYTSNFFSSADALKMYTPAYNGSSFILSDDDNSNQETVVAGLGSSNFTPGTSFVAAPFLDTIGGGSDPSNNWNNTSYNYTMPYGAHVIIVTNIVGGSYINGYLEAHLMKNGSTDEILNIGINGGGNSFTIIQKYYEAGDVLSVAVKGSTSSTTMQGYSTAGHYHTGSSYFQVFDISEPLQGITVDMARNMPDMTQIDYLMSLQKMFNLVIVEDKNKPKHLIIEPFNDYVAAGTSKDWTNKIDYTKDIVIKPTTDIQKAEQIWTYDKGQDFLNKAIQDGVGRTYGRHRVQDTENDFANGNAKIQNAFAPYVVSNIPGSAIPIHRMVTDKGEAVQTPKGRIAYYLGLTAGAEWYIRLDNGNELGIPSIPLFSNYNDSEIDVGDNDLNYGYEQPFIANDGHPINTLYYKYWMNYVNELYSADARIITLYLRLNDADIQDFEFSDRIYLKDTYYRVLKISNYDATSGGSTKVELIKILSDIADCVDQPTSSSNGIVYFNGSSPGASADYGSKACCERYGYHWFPDKSGGNSRCLIQPAQITPPVSG